MCDYSNLLSSLDSAGGIRTVTDCGSRNIRYYFNHDKIYLNFISGLYYPCSVLLVGDITVMQRT